MYIVITYLDCLCRTIKNIIITTEITSPDKAIANIVAKAMIVVLLSSELLLLLASIKQ